MCPTSRTSSVKGMSSVPIAKYLPQPYGAFFRLASLKALAIQKYSFGLLPRQPKKSTVISVQVFGNRNTRRLRIVSLLVAAAAVLAGCRNGMPPNFINTLEDVNGSSIGAYVGSPSIRLADEMGVARGMYTGDELMNSLKAGMLDCVIMEKTAAEALVERTAGVRILAEPLLEYDMRFAVAKENAELLQAINSALVALGGNGTLGSIRDKYFAMGDFEYIPPEGVPGHPGTLILALPPDSPPYSSMDADGGFFGMDVDVARAICDYLGVELQIIDYDAGELVTAVWFGRADIALGWLPGEAEGRVNISEPYAHAINVVIVRK